LLPYDFIRQDLLDFEDFFVVFEISRRNSNEQSATPRKDLSVAKGVVIGDVDTFGASAFIPFITRSSYQSQAVCKLLRSCLFSNPFGPNPE